MTALCCFALLSCGVDDAIDPVELSKIRSSLESYLSRIQSIRMLYSERSNEDPEPPPILRQYNELIAKRQQETLQSASPKSREELARLFARGKAETVREYDVLDAFPSLRMIIREHSQYANGELNESVREIFIHGSTFAHVDRSAKQVHYRNTGERLSLPRTPIEALGLRVSGSINMHLSDLLGFPEVTTSGRTEVIDGIQCVVIRVGPQLPVAARPMGWQDEDWAKIWLAANHQHLPIRMERYMESAGLGKHDMQTSNGGVARFLRHVYELRGLQPANDIARGEKVLFPRRVTFADGAGVWDWEVHDVEINPIVRDSDFNPAVQDGYAVARDGKPPTVTLSGGTPAFEKRVEETASQARDLLAIAIPPNPTKESRVSWRYIVPVAFAGLTVGLLLLKRRFRHVS